MSGRGGGDGGQMEEGGRRGGGEVYGNIELESWRPFIGKKSTLQVRSIGRPSGQAGGATLSAFKLNVGMGNGTMLS